MRKMAMLVVAAMVAAATSLVGAPPAHASPACLGTPSGPWCDWVNNGDFSQGERYWVFHNDLSQYRPVVMPVGDACQYNGPYVAELRRNASVSQQMSIWAGYGPKFTIAFDLYLREDTETFYDAFNVIVKDLNTGTVERVQYNGNAFNSTCNISVELSKNYSGHTVELKFTTGAFAVGYYQVDDVQFWSHP